MPDTLSRPCGDIGGDATCSFGNPLHEGVVGSFSCSILLPDNFLKLWLPQRPCLPSGSVPILFARTPTGTESMTLEERIAKLEVENVALWEQMTVLADPVGADLSLGTLVAWVNQAAATLEPVEASIKAAVPRASVLPSL
jgi:hypothetical protein